MVKHVVMWRLKEFAEGAGKAQNAVRVKAKLESMRGVVGGFTSLEVGLNVGTSENASDVVLITEHPDFESLSAYQNDPVHLNDVVPFIRNLVDERRILDFEV